MVDSTVGVDGDEYGTRAMSLSYEELLEKTDEGRNKA
jgi:hypothetical protein